MLKNKWVNFVRLFVSTWLNLVYIFFFKRSGPKFCVAISLPNVNEFWVLGIICVTWVAWRNGNPARSCFRLCKLSQFIWGNHWRDETCTNKGVRGGWMAAGNIGPVQTYDCCWGQARVCSEHHQLKFSTCQTSNIFPLPSRFYLWPVDSVDQGLGTVITNALPGQ